MAIQSWLGTATAVAQVSTIAITAYDATTTYKITINGKVVSVVGSGGTTATTATALQAALAASTIPEFAEITWTVGTSTITATAKTAGKPFIAASSVTGGTGTIGAVTAVTASSGPNDPSTAANWSNGALVNGDDVYLQNSAVSLLYNLGALSAVTLNSFTADLSFTGNIGLPTIAGSGSATYTEYRPTYLAIGATTVTIGGGSGNGSGRIKIDTGTAQTLFSVLGTGSSVDLAIGLKSVLWKGSHAANVVNVNKGSFAAAAFAGETATILTLNEAYLSSPATDADVKLGAGCTLTNINKIGGTLELNSNCTLLAHAFGTTTIKAGTPTTTKHFGGTIYFTSTGTPTNYYHFGGTLDYSQDDRPRTVTNYTMNAGAILNDPGKSVTWTNGIILNGQTSDVTLNIGFGMTLQRS